MKFKLIVALISDHETELVLKTARDAGATGSTVVTSARGEGLKPIKTFLGLDLESQRDVILLLVEGHLCRSTNSWKNNRTARIGSTSKTVSPRVCASSVSQPMMPQTVMP